MMFESSGPESRAIITDAVHRAKNLGHNYLGGEHLLMALAASQTPAGEALRGQGVTAARVTEIIHARTPFADLDREALAAIGIDLDRVATAVTQRFGAQALRPALRPAGRFRLTPRARQCLRAARRAARRGPANRSGPEHLAIAVVGLKHGAVPNILTELGTTAARLRTDIGNRYRPAG